jgi:hypothetical protein
MDLKEMAWELLVEQVTWYAPTLLALGVGIFVALWRWQRHRRVSLLAIVGVMLYLSSIASSLWITWRFIGGDLPNITTEMEEHARRIKLIQ